MGCDIHMILEVKHDKNWIGLHDFHNLAFRDDAGKLAYSIPAVRERNYNLFSALADVRSAQEGEGTPPKGIPNDASHLARYIIDSFGADGHSHTWYLLSEALPIFIAHCAPTEMLDEPRSSLPFRLFGVEEGDEDHDKVYKRHRLIIFFDN